VPYLEGASDWTGLLAAEAGAGEHVAQGAAAGWILLRQRSPTLESFEDWSEPALDAMGEPIAGLSEIPNDNLDNRRTRAQPVSGIAGVRMAEPIGRVSGQTLADANLLRLELVYGVRLGVPVVGSLVLRTLSAWNGCSSASPAPWLNGPQGGGQQPSAGDREPGANRLGLVLLGPVGPLPSAQAWQCGFYGARDDEGRADGRIPVRLSATMRMMSTARRSDTTRPREDSPSGVASLGIGRFDSAGSEPVPGDRNDGSGSAAASRGRSDGSESGSSGSSGAGSGGRALPALPPQSSLANGFLGIGSDRPYPQPANHPALCAG
jgi:hypothetical protein